MTETTLHRNPLYDEAVREVRDLLDEPTATEPLAVYQTTTRADTVTARPAELVSAMVTWMSVVFVLSYMILPLFTEYAGLFDGLIWHLPGNAVAFALTTFFTVLGVLIARPKVQLRSAWDNVQTDPVIAATSGSLLVWAFLHNTVWGLTPFTMMGPGELSTFILLNVIESGLFGMMLASLASGRSSAFLLGGLFQLMFMGTSILLMI